MAGFLHIAAPCINGLIGHDGTTDQRTTARIIQDSPAQITGPIVLDKAVGKPGGVAITILNTAPVLVYLIIGNGTANQGAASSAVENTPCVKTRRAALHHCVL